MPSPKDKLDAPGYNVKLGTYDYTNYMLDLFLEDLLAIDFVEVQHEGCYRVNILKRKIKELHARYQEQISKDKYSNT